MKGEIRYTQAIVRRPGADCGRGLTTAGLGEPQYDELLEQHSRYRTALESLGVVVHALEPLPGYPDAYFVEDVAVVTPAVAVLTRPGAESRRGEESAMEAVLSRFRPVERIIAPGTVDGGDIVQIGEHFLIGVSDRTNEEGAAQLARILAAAGYTSAALAVGSGLHLKTDVNALDEETLLVTAEYAGRPELGGYRKVVVPGAEEYAANSVAINGAVLIPAGCEKTRALVETHGLATLALEMSEARKMDGGLSCFSLRF